MGNEQLEAGNIAGERTCWRTSSSAIDWGEREIAEAMCSPRFVKAFGKQLVDDGRLDSVSLYSVGPTADFLELDTQEWQEDGYDQQGNLLDPIKVKEGRREKIHWVLKQKLFDDVSESNCAERQGRLCSLKCKGEKVRARLVVREIKKPKSEDEKLEPSDVFSAMPQWRNMAHFMGVCVCERDVYVEPPSEIHRPGLVAKLDKTMYGTHNASIAWQKLERTPPQQWL